MMVEPVALRLQGRGRARPRNTRWLSKGGDEAVPAPFLAVPGVTGFRALLGVFRGLFS